MMAQEDDIRYAEYRLLRIDHQTVLREPSNDLFHGDSVLLLRDSGDEDVVNVDISTGDAVQHSVHQPHEGLGGILEAVWHSQEFKKAEWRGDRGEGNGGLRQWYLMERTYKVNSCEVPCPAQVVRELLIMWERISVWNGGSVKLAEVAAWPPLAAVLGNDVNRAGHRTVGSATYPQSHHSLELFPCDLEFLSEQFPCGRARQRLGRIYLDVMFRIRTLRCYCVEGLRYFRVALQQFFIEPLRRCRDAFDEARDALVRGREEVTVNNTSAPTVHQQAFLHQEIVSEQRFAYLTDEEMMVHLPSESEIEIHGPAVVRCDGFSLCILEECVVGGREFAPVLHRRRQHAIHSATVDDEVNPHEPIEDAHRVRHGWVVKSWREFDDGGGHPDASRESGLRHDANRRCVVAGHHALGRLAAELCVIKAQHFSIRLLECTIWLHYSQNVLVVEAQLLLELLSALSAP